MNIKQSSFDYALRIKTEGIVLLGAGGDPDDWLNGVHGMWKDEGIADGKVTDNITEAFTMNTTGGRTDLVLVFDDKNRINIHKLAMWRLRFGACSWLSDYKYNYADQHQPDEYDAA